MHVTLSCLYIYSNSAAVLTNTCLKDMEEEYSKKLGVLVLWEAYSSGPRQLSNFWRNTPPCSFLGNHDSV